MTPAQTRELVENLRRYSKGKGLTPREAEQAADAIEALAQKVADLEFALSRWKLAEARDLECQCPPDKQDKFLTRNTGYVCRACGKSIGLSDDAQLTATPVCNHPEHEALARDAGRMRVALVSARAWLISTAELQAMPEDSHLKGVAEIDAALAPAKDDLSRKAAEREAASGDPDCTVTPPPRGTFSCPICRKDTLHHHSEAEIQRYRDGKPFYFLSDKALRMLELGKIGAWGEQVREVMRYIADIEPAGNLTPTNPTETALAPAKEVGGGDR